MEELVLAVDPGRQKLGAALLEGSAGTLLRRGVLSVEDLEEHLTGFLGEERSRLDVVVLGDGTAAGALRERILDLVGEGPRVETVDETGSTLEARQLFYKVHPPTGLLAWLPRGLWPEPDTPLDGFAAEVLGRRWLAEGSGSGPSDPA